MQRKLWSRRASWLGMVAMVLGSGAVAQAQRVEKDGREVLVVLEDGTQSGDAVRVEKLDVGDKAERYWIGVSCSQAGEALRTQLALTDGHGLVVDEVIDKSPAQKANLKKFDVLIKAGDKPLKSLDDLVTVVQNSKQSPITVTLLRGGKHEALTVTPTKDPVQQPGVLAIEVPAGEALREWLGDGQQWFEVNPEGHFTIRQPHPGIAFKFKNFTTVKLPKNVSITISKTGEEPAKITVKRDDKTWEVAESKLDDLPEDLRKIVRSFLEQTQSARVSAAPQVRAIPRVDLTKEWKTEDLAKALNEWKKSQAESAKARPGRRSVEERLESLDKKMEKLQQALEQLRESKPLQK
jgi:hypothetical protein